jgi:lipopolysaccharide transport system permease protein
VEGSRWAILGSRSVALGPTSVSAIVTLALLGGGLLFFRRMEREFADLI